MAKELHDNIERWRNVIPGESRAIDIKPIPISKDERKRLDEHDQKIWNFIKGIDTSILSK